MDIIATNNLAVTTPNGYSEIKTLPDWWFDIWSTHGWTDGRHFNTPDPMHVQFATGA